MPYKMPALRCRNCYLFGHGALACRRKVRCTNCSGFHPLHSTDGVRCSNPPFCYFCREGHRLNYRSCPALQRAEEIHSDCQLRQLSPRDTNNLLRTILPRAVPPPATSHVPASSSWVPQPSLPRRPPDLPLNNSFAILSAMDEDSDRDFFSDVDPYTSPAPRPRPSRPRQVRRRSTGNTPARQFTLSSSTRPFAPITVHQAATPPSTSPPHGDAPAPPTYADVTARHQHSRQVPVHPAPSSLGETSGFDWLSLFPTLLDILRKGYILHQQGNSFLQILRRLLPAVLSLFNL